MAQATADQDAAPPPLDLRATGERIDLLLDASGSGGALARERAEELLRLVTDLYGAGLERFMELLHESGRLDEALLAEIAADDLLASLLLVHGLHPDGVQARVEQALDSVRPYLGSHGGDVELLAVTDDTVRLRLLGSCDGCPSSSVTLKLAVEGAIEAAAPEVTTIEVETSSGEAQSHGSGPVIPVHSLRSRLDQPVPAGGAAGWHQVDLTGLRSEGVATVVVGQEALLVCRIGADLFAFADRCARCGASLAGSAVSRRLGGAVGEGVLRCPSCRAHYDIRGAGRCLDQAELHLDPLPLIGQGSSVSVAVPGSVAS